ncbi:hypothetical protein [Peribacillus butanolivorans]|uniref:hypothetical protein n=1 Tax=Peribacillus butanolivorans TaxID=421767 RepID=UPI001145AA54|nr:hypothetical protein [Peribacillus butanolivorans]QNU02959.1 hypothetical protein GM240_02575 [Peribacillus butanolivorans]
MEVAATRNAYTATGEQSAAIEEISVLAEHPRTLEGEMDEMQSFIRLMFAFYPIYLKTQTIMDWVFYFFFLVLLLSFLLR